MVVICLHTCTQHGIPQHNWNSLYTIIISNSGNLFALHCLWIPINLRLANNNRHFKCVRAFSVRLNTDKLSPRKQQQTFQMYVWELPLYDHLGCINCFVFVIVLVRSCIPLSWVSNHCGESEWVPHWWLDRAIFSGYTCTLFMSFSTLDDQNLSMGWSHEIGAIYLSDMDMTIAHYLLLMTPPQFSKAVS